MRLVRHSSLITLGLLILSTMAAHAGTVHFADVVYEATSSKKHPTKDERSIIIREDTGGPVKICIGYINNSQELNLGFVSSVVEISRGEALEGGGFAKAIETVDLGGPVRNNAFGDCKTVAGMMAGDSVSFPLVFDGFARLKKGGLAIVAGAVAVDDGDPAVRSACGAGGSVTGLTQSTDGTVLLADVVHQAVEREKHRTRDERTIIIREDMATDEEVQLCLGYLRDGTDLDSGRLITKAKVSRVETAANGSFVKAIQKVKLASKIRDGGAQKCKDIDPLKAGDSVTFPLKYKGMPRLEGGSTATTITAVVMGGAHPFRNITCTTSTGGTGGTGGGGGGGGGGTATDNREAAQVLRGCAGGGVGVQFQWDQGQLKVDRRDAGGSITTIGPFSSFSAAANAAKARWSCGPGKTTTADAGSEMTRLAGWGSVSGRRLALRFENTGGSQVYVDAWSSGTGAIHGSAHGSVAAAIRNFCARSNINC